jgi:hypothetical protein
MVSMCLHFTCCPYLGTTSARPQTYPFAGAGTLGDPGLEAVKAQEEVGRAGRAPGSSLHSQEFWLPSVRRAAGPAPLLSRKARLRDW